MKEDLYGEKEDLAEAMWMNDSAELESILEDIKPTDRFNSLMTTWKSTEFTDGPLRAALAVRFPEGLQIMLDGLKPSQKETLLNSEINYVTPIITIALQENNPTSKVHKCALEILKDLTPAMQKTLWGVSVNVMENNRLRENVSEL